MDDAEYVFRTDCADKKKTGRGAFSKVRGGGRYVRMPSDNMTRKEKTKLNGEVMSYDMSKPVKWDVYRRWPEDIQVAYFKKRYVEDGFSQRMIAEIFGVSQPTIKVYAQQMNIPCRSSGGKVAEATRQRFKEFLDRKEEAQKIEPAEEVYAVCPAEESKPEETVVKIKPETTRADISNIAALLNLLCGTGAKLTIEVTL